MVPVVCGQGAPSPAANCRPFRNRVASPTTATKGGAAKAPQPALVCTRRQEGGEVQRRPILFSSDVLRSSTVRDCVGPDKFFFLPPLRYTLRSTQQWSYHGRRKHKAEQVPGRGLVGCSPPHATSRSALFGHGGAEGTRRSGHGSPRPSNPSPATAALPERASGSAHPARHLAPSPYEFRSPAGRDALLRRRAGYPAPCPVCPGDAAGRGPRPASAVCASCRPAPGALGPGGSAISGGRPHERAAGSEGTPRTVPSGSHDPAMAAATGAGAPPAAHPGQTGGPAAHYHRWPTDHRLSPAPRPSPALVGPARLYADGAQ